MVANDLTFMTTKSNSKKATTELTPRKHADHSSSYKVGVSGAAETGHCAIDAVDKAEQIGRAIAEAGMVLVTGATTGMPYWSAKGAKEAGGFVVGLSPAASEASHLKTYHLPTDYHDIIVYTGFEYSGRNLLLTRSVDAVIIVCGRIGTLNEFTIAFEDHKPIGILEDSGGTADMIDEIIKRSHRNNNNIVYSKDPAELVTKVSEMIKKDKMSNNLKGRY